MADLMRSNSVVTPVIEKGKEEWRKIKLTADVVQVEILHEHPLQYTDTSAGSKHEMKDME